MTKLRVFSVFATIFLIVVGVAAQEDGPPPMPDLGEGEIVVEGLNSPQGVYVDSTGTLWVADSGMGGDETIDLIDATTWEVIEAPFGDSSRIMRVVDGEPEVMATLPSAVAGQDFIGVARLLEVEGDVYATVGLWHENLGESVTVDHFGDVVRLGDEGVTSVASLWDVELSSNPDETTNIETHPYDMAAGPDGLIYVTDAAGNFLVSVDPADGTTELVATFGPLPGVFPAPHRGGELLQDPVPTGVAFNEAGDLFVSLLSGAPFIPGSAKVVQVGEDGEVSDFALGLTMLTDLTTAPDGNLYATSFGVFTQQGPQPNSGSVVRILEDGSSEVVVDGLPFVTGIAFNEAGDAYVIINGAAIPNAGMVVRYAGLTDMEGTPIEMPMQGS